MKLTQKRHPETKELLGKCKICKSEFSIKTDEMSRVEKLSPVVYRKCSVCDLPMNAGQKVLSVIAVGLGHSPADHTVVFHN